MNQGFRVPSLLSGILLLTLVLGWLVLGWSNRSTLIPLFFLGSQTLTYPIVLWLLGAFLLGNGISFALLSLLQFIASESFSPGRSSSQRSFFSPGANRSFPEEEWDEEEADRPASKPFSSGRSTSNPTVNPAINPTVKPNSNPFQNDRVPSWDDEDDEDEDDWLDDPSEDVVPVAPQTSTQSASQPRSADSPQGKVNPSVNPNDRASTVLPREDVPRQDLPREPVHQAPVQGGEGLDEDESDAWDDPQWTGEDSSPGDPNLSPDLSSDLSSDLSPDSTSDPSPETIASDLSSEVGKVYETEPAPRQGSQSGSTYSYRYRPSRRTAQPPSEPSPPRPASDNRRRAGQPQSVVDVNYRVIKPGKKADGTDETRETRSPVTPPPRNDRGRSRNVANPPDGGWDQDLDEDWD